MNRKTAVIHQPDFMPYLGFFHRLLQSDLYIALDHVQFSKGGWHNRDKIKTPEGVKWLTLPVRLAGRSYSPINEVRLKNSLNWKVTHLNQLERCYRGAVGFDEIFPELRDVYSFDGDRMVDFNLHALAWLMEKFDVSVNMILSSTLAPRGASNEMLVDILTKVGATQYLSGIGARDYYKPSPFEAKGIQVLWQDFTHPVYQQRYGEFVPFLSSLDLLLNHGITKSREILRSCL
jgi:hypothetical protein